MRNWSPVIIGVVLVLILVIAVPFFWNEDDQNLTIFPQPTEVQEPQGGGPNSDEISPPSISDILANPANYRNRTVIIEGEIDTIYTPRAFRIDQEGSVVGDEIVVLSRTPLPATDGRTSENPLRDGDDVEVTGIVRILSVVEAERELGLDLDPQLEIELDRQQPIIVAENITFLPGDRE